MEEVKAAAAAAGYILPDDIVDFMIELDPLQMYFAPSMLEDVRHGRFFEYENIIGEPLRVGKELGIAIPTVSMLYSMCKASRWRTKKQKGLVELPFRSTMRNLRRVWIGGLRGLRLGNLRGELMYAIPRKADKVLLGYHLWGMDQWPKAENLAYAEMEKGVAYIMLGGTYRAGGENTTTDETRLMHGLFFTRGVMRAEMYRYLIHFKEDVEVQRKMGFHLSSPNSEIVDFQSPVEWMQGVDRPYWVDPDSAFTGAPET